jgi:hypothetical protein
VATHSGIFADLSNHHYSCIHGHWVSYFCAISRNAVNVVTLSQRGLPLHRRNPYRSIPLLFRTVHLRKSLDRRDTNRHLVVVFLAPRPPAGILLAIAKECLPASRVRSLSTKVFGVTLLILICATLTVVILLHGVLPVLDVKGNYSRITTTGVAPALQLFTALTLIAHWRITRLQTVLQLWLAVGLFVVRQCDNHARGAASIGRLVRWST